MTMLSAAVPSSDNAHGQPGPMLSHAISAAISSSQADAPNAIATPVNASVRPNALRASEMSADSRMRNALDASRPASQVARPVAPSSRSDSSIPCRSSRRLSSPLESPSPDDVIDVAYLSPPLRASLAMTQPVAN